MQETSLSANQRRWEGQQERPCRLPERAAEPVNQAPTERPAWACRHYTVHDLAALWNLSHDSITRIFRNEPGVLEITPKKRRGMRTRRTLRVPEHVATAVYLRLVRKNA